MAAVSKAAQDLAGTALGDGLPALGRCRMRVAIGDDAFTVSIKHREIEFPLDGGDRRHDFTYELDLQAWEAFCSDPPPRGYTSAQAIDATLGGSCVRGDRTVWATYAAVVDRVLDALRDRVGGSRRVRYDDPQPAEASFSQITGGYVHVPVFEVQRRIYFEVAGMGQDVLCLHTAGADSRQFRYLLEDDELTARFRFIAFDMPWHGRSEPPDDWPTASYRLDTETYAETVLAFIGAVGLKQPVLVGCSMGGAIALYLASEHGDQFRGVCALEGGLGNPGRLVDWTNHIAVDHSHFLTSWVGGLIAPRSPTGPRNQTLWGYAQSGPSVYQGDTYFYSEDFPKFAPSLSEATCPLWIFSGEYDYSATTEMSREAAEKLGGELVEMKGSGHFPMSEDPDRFRPYLVPVLDRIEASR